MTSDEIYVTKITILLFNLLLLHMTLKMLHSLCMSGGRAELVSSFTHS